MTVAPWAEAVGRLVKQRLEDQLQEAANHLLGDAISNCWNTERAKVRFIFGDESAPQRERLEGAVLELPHEGVEVVGQVGLEHFDADLVNARLAPVSFDRFEGGAKQGQGDSAGERMSLALGRQVHSCCWFYDHAVVSHNDEPHPALEPAFWELCLSGHRIAAQEAAASRK